MNVHDYVGVIAPGLTLDRPSALVAAARSRGVSTAVDDELSAARAELDDLDASVPELASARRRVAETEAVVEARRERVAELRGRLRVRREHDLCVTEKSYHTAIRELTEAETEHLAARERLVAIRQQARRARDERERRLSLQDRIANLEREARARLRRSVRPAVDDAVRAAPGSDATSFDDADDVTAALGVVRIARTSTPVVLACRRFPNGPTAETWLRAPVCWL